MNLNPQNRLRLLEFAARCAHGKGQLLAPLDVAGEAYRTLIAAMEEVAPLDDLSFETSLERLNFVRNTACPDWEDIYGMEVIQRMATDYRKLMGLLSDPAA